MAGANPRSKAGALYSRLKLLTLKDITTYQQCIFIYQCINKIMPVQFVQLFDINQNLYKYNTRSSSLTTFAQTQNVVIPDKIFVL